jgi:hypothetical protein
MMAREPVSTTTAPRPKAGRSSWALAATPFGSFTNETYFGRTDGRAHCTGRADRASCNQRDCGLDIRQSNLGGRVKATAGSPQPVGYTPQYRRSSTSRMMGSRRNRRYARRARRDADAPAGHHDPGFVVLTKGTGRRVARLPAG